MKQTTVSRDLVIALRRKRGEENVSIQELAQQTGVSTWTLRAVLNSEGGKPTRPSTIAKLNEWLYQRV
ncbi:helix-turn-helix domain-containing protein [Lacticaseibacillus songhuajiangensis]|jgi:LacI family transcriptional regulator|uniref:helix-turn-helix domain-containing protein n=1 Tax=Lacticaseibacillus songhuajiangensis TaxID=1296539 RepID=UPI000F79DE82|nr:helix-turn-helix domain-containing protein [Lacticaseibacillus songhuajiangensis]